VTLNSAGIGTFTDNSVSGVLHRFYHVSNGSTCSQAIGFVRLTANPGQTSIANQLDAAPNNNAELGVRPRIPARWDQVQIWNGSGFDTSTWKFRAWSPTGMRYWGPVWGRSSLIRPTTVHGLVCGFGAGKEA